MLAMVLMCAARPRFTVVPDDSTDTVAYMTDWFVCLLIKEPHLDVHACRSIGSSADLAPHLSIHVTPSVCHT
jgi:hypothetical protein